MHVYGRLYTTQAFFFAVLKTPVYDKCALLYILLTIYNSVRDYST